MLQAAGTLGYRPDSLARGLASKPVNLVAILVNHIHDLSDLELFDLLLGGLPQRFRLYGFDDISLTRFDAYPISSIGADKRDYVARIVRILNRPAHLAESSDHVLVATRFVPRLTG